MTHRNSFNEEEKRGVKRVEILLLLLSRLENLNKSHLLFYNFHTDLVSLNEYRTIDVYRFLVLFPPQ